MASTGTVPASPAPRLYARSAPLDEFPELIDYVDPREPLLWVRRGDGLVGQGVAHRIVTRGPERFAEAARQWRELVSRADVEDGVGLVGSGLVAFGSFAFADASQAESVLLVPRRLIGIRDGRCWVTRIWAEGETEPEPPVRSGDRSFGSARVVFSAGAQSPEGYLSAVEEAVRRIRSSELAKVVLARDAVGSLPAPADLRAPILRLAQAYTRCWIFAVEGLLGASPETLITVHEGVATARVLAGTASRGADRGADQAAAQALAASEKDHDEHAFAVESAVASLRPHVRALSRSEEPFTLKLPNVWHLASDIEAEVADGSDSLALAAALHPTAAVAGSPPELALRVIAELEPFDRERYAGPVGWIDAEGDGEWAIALRCASVSFPGQEPGGGSDRGVVHAYAGAGIVGESDPQRELAETRVKFRPILDAFA